MATGSSEIDGLPEMHGVLSSHITRVGQNGPFLYIEFVDGKIARYNGAGPDILEQLRQSESPGRTFNELVRGKLSFSYVGG
jgi:hypothetical protein